MSKKLTKSIAAAAAALLMATQAMAFSASAVQNYFYYYNGIYYSSPADAAAAAGNNLGAYESVPYSMIPSGAKLKYYDPVAKKYYDTKDDAITAGVKNPVEIYVGSYYINNNYYTSGTGYYCSLNGKYYTTYSEALTAAGGQAKYVTYVGSVARDNLYYSSYTGLYYSTYQAALNASRGDSSKVSYMGGDYWYDYYGYSNGYGYFYSSYTGKYYSTYAAALSASKGISSYVVPVGYLYTNSSTAALGSIYKYYYNGVAYPSLQAAKDAGGTVGVDIYYSPYGNTERVGYYYYYNGTYYGTLEAAKAAGGTALGTDITYVPYNYYGNAYTNYYGYYGYIDPYYALRNDLLNTNKVTTSTKEAEDGEPYIYGNKKKAGWSTVIKYIEAASKGSNIKVDMNGASTISKDVLKALDGKNVSVTFVLDNGVKWTINGKDVDTAQDMIIYTKYNIDYIPNTLVKKASKDAVSKAQIGISNDYSSFGSEASVTVRFSDKRAGCVAVVYRYDPDSNSLKGVDKAKVQSDGSCTFSVTAGGPYLIVLK
ncbi:hypothetical protein [Huintestinicola sp.]|uniref:hypothetical protein n=1 Tax=Huintestinicola sp. TaxID=2981661 RepID=UPI003D7D5AB8